MVLKPCFLHTDPRNHEKIFPGVRGKAGFTHESGDFAPDVRGKRFSAHVAEERRGSAEEKRGLSKKRDVSLARKQKKQAGHCARPAFIRLPWGN